MEAKEMIEKVVGGVVSNKPPEPRGRVLKQRIGSLKAKQAQKRNKPSRLQIRLNRRNMEKEKGIVI